MTKIDVMKVMYHPITGAMLEPLGSRADGRLIWPIMGGSQSSTEGTGGGSGDGSQSGSGTGGDGSQSGSGTGTGDGKGGDTGDGSQSGTSKDDTVSRTDYEALQRRQSAADQAKAAAEKELQALKDKDASELEVSKRKLGESEKQVTVLQSENRHLVMQVAFLSDSTIAWHDPADALMHLERNMEEYGVTLGDDGKVNGMKGAVKKLSEAKKYLVKPEENGQGGGTATQSSGGNVGGSGKGGDGKAPDRTELSKRFPALRR
jgi:hypothetical protein